MQYILVLFILGLLVLVHETGHFLAARVMGMPVARFSIGFGPAVWKRKKGGVEYVLAAAPLGGYVLLDLKDEKDYLAIPLYKRIVFALGGPLANIGAAVPLYAAFNTMAGFTWKGVFVAPFMQVGLMVEKIWLALAGLFSSPEAVGGVVGLVADGGRYVGLDPARAVALAAALSLNLAVFNLLPLPPLDGGKIILDSLQRLSRKITKAYIPATVCGWLLIVGLMLYATVMDIGRLWA